ncbi:MAG: CapA family protein [Ignavibacteria bacterium]
MLLKILFIAALILAINSCGNNIYDSKKVSSTGKYDSLEKVVIVKTSIKDSLITLIATGDIMPGSNYPYSSSLPPDDGKHLFDSVKEILRSADVTFGNLEGTLLNSGGTPKKCLTPDNCVSFRIPEAYAGLLEEAGFDVVSVANNHSNDMNEEGTESTKRTLEQYGINYAGYTDSPFSLFEKNGVRYGFAAFAPNNGTVSLNDIPNAVKIVTELKKNSDIVIVSFHGGAEGYSAQRVTREREFYLEEDRGNVYEFAHAVIDAGADVVFGHGPHVPRAVELYNNKIIAYSLGNFCTYAKFSLSGSQGVAPLLKVYLNKNGGFVKGKLYSFRQINRGVPVADEELNALYIIKELSKKDFPESLLSINDNGTIERTKTNISTDDEKTN